MLCPHCPVSCYLATRGAEILGYACYDATAPDFFGPTRVLDSEQGKGIGKALLLRCLHALRAEGYAYAIIGGVGAGGLLRKVRGRPGDSRFHARDLPGLSGGH